MAAGHGLRGDPAAAFFYLITALHGLHVIGGLWFWARAMLDLRAGRDAVLPVQLTAAYWHFLLLGLAADVGAVRVDLRRQGGCRR